MGAIQLEETHVKRSSSMTFALRWKHGNLRMVGLIALISFALAFMFFMLLYGTATKRVSVTVDGKERIVHTRTTALSRLLDEQKLTIDAHDRVSASLDAKLKNGDEITIVHTTPVVLTADGETKTMYTTGKTVQSALQDLHIALGTDDKLTPALETSVTDQTQIQIVRVKKETTEATVTIAFDTVKKQDSTLQKGKEKVVQEGKEGSKIVKTEKVYEDGKLVATNVVGEEVKTDSIEKVVAVGTKKQVVALSASSPSVDTVTKGSVSFDYKQILRNVTLTAYSADPGSTGKSSGSPEYGMTYTGTSVTEGRTIAVDKNVIPLGWWVYIEGIGLRRAEDTGSGVKGNMIDVYYDSPSYAERFGMKHGYTVYVIGPKKPATN